MAGGGARESRPTTVVYCIVPRDLAGRLHGPLRQHFRDEPHVEVVVERRGADRRRSGERRVVPGDSHAPERRRIRALAGRRIADRRAPVFEVEPLSLPRKAQRHAERLAFVERPEPPTERVEDVDTARLVTRFQAGEQDVFGEIYLRYFSRVYSYFLLLLRDQHEAEDATQQVFTQLLGRLHEYERRAQPFRAYLFVIARHLAMDILRKRRVVELEDRDTLDRRREGVGDDAPQPDALRWITDREVLMFLERLPPIQQQVLFLRFMLDLRVNDVARILDRSPVEVRQLQHRALRFLRQRLAAVGERDSGFARDPMRIRVRPARILRRRRFALL